MERSSKLKVIYILGHSRSGSTILGFHLGSIKKVFFAGEIKRYGKRILSRICTCGKGTLDCDLWGSFIKSNPSYFSKISRNDNFLLKVVSTIKYLSVGPSKKSIATETTLIKNLHKAVNDNFENCNYIVDSSKSLNRLIVLKAIPEFEVYTIYLQRNLRDNLASFVKRKQNLILNYFRLRINDSVMNWYLKHKSKRHFLISYEDLIENQQNITYELCSFFEMKDYAIKPAETAKYHVATGSSNTRKAHREKSKVEITNRNVDDPFTAFQKKLLTLLGL